jgi:hypothetical protein
VPRRLRIEYPGAIYHVSRYLLLTQDEYLWLQCANSEDTGMVWLLVRIHMMNQNAYPAVSEDVLAALPTRATRGKMNGNHTAFFNTGTVGRAAGALSHKVWAAAPP